MSPGRSHAENFERIDSNVTDGVHSFLFWQPWVSLRLLRFWLKPSDFCFVLSVLSCGHSLRVLVVEKSQSKCPKLLGDNGLFLKVPGGSIDAELIEQEREHVRLFSNSFLQRGADAVSSAGGAAKEDGPV